MSRTTGRKAQPRYLADIGFSTTNVSNERSRSRERSKDPDDLEHSAEFAYHMGGGGSMALWQKRSGQEKPLTPRTRKRKLREARKKAAEERKKREEEERLAELLRIQQEKEEEERRRREEEERQAALARKLAKKRENMAKAMNCLARITFGWKMFALWNWARACDKLLVRQWVLREELLDLMADVKESESDSEHSAESSEEEEDEREVRIAARRRRRESRRRTEAEHRLLTHALVAGASNGIMVLCQTAVTKGAQVDQVGDIASAALLLALPPSLAGLPGCTGLEAALAAGELEITLFLLSHGAHAHTARHEDGVTPLIMCAGLPSNGAGSKDFIEVLLASGADPNHEDATGRSPLVYSLMAGNEAATQLLIEHGADTGRAIDKLRYLGDGVVWYSETLAQRTTQLPAAKVAELLHSSIRGRTF